MFFTENQIWEFLNTELNIWEQEYSESVTIKRSFQPTQQKVPTSFFAYLFQIHNRRFGWQGSEDIWDDETETMIHVDRYIYNKTIQLSTQTITSPKSQFTSGDVAESIAAYLMTPKVISSWKAQGMEIIRIIDVRHPHFVNDANRFEGDPSFDFVLSYTQEIESTGVAVDNVSGSVYNDSSLPLP